MKKIILFLVPLFALAIGFASCSSDDQGTAESDVLSQNVKKYGVRSSDVSVYFGASEIAATRATDVNGNMWGDNMPKYPTEEEKQGILAYVRSNQGGTTIAWPGYTYYFVQDVIGAHNKYSYIDLNKFQHNDIDGTSHLDLLEIKEANHDYYTHVNNFNNGKCDNAATHNSTLMTEGFQDIRSHDSFGNHYVDDWKLFYWEGNYYLGFDYKMTKDDGKIEPDGVYDDWIMKILPGKGETPVVPSPDKPTNPDSTKTPVKHDASVEFDIHEQEHTDWNEIKTSVHVRDTAAVHVFLPIPLEMQALADDVDIRAGENYEKINYSEDYTANFEFADHKFSFPVKIEHNASGIDIYIDCTTEDAKSALKLARGVFDDGITFEIHSYVNPNITTDQIWNMLETVKLPSTKTAQWPKEGDICTHVYGQVSSAYHMDEMIHFDQRP